MVEEMFHEVVTLKFTLTKETIDDLVDKLQGYRAQGYKVCSIEHQTIPVEDPQTVSLTMKLEREKPNITTSTSVPVVSKMTPIISGDNLVTIGKTYNTSAPSDPIVQLPVDGIKTVTVTGPYGSNLRDKPTTVDSTVFVKIATGELATVLTATRDSDNFVWYNVIYGAYRGWVREDNVSTNIQIAQQPVELDEQPPAVVMKPMAAPLPKPVVTVSNGPNTAKFPLPVPAHNNTTAYDPTGLKIGFIHTGWDYADSVGTPIHASASGVVFKAEHCQNCGDAGLSSVSAGFARGDSRVLNDPKWNYGFGHYVVIRYDWSVLPLSTQQWLTSKGWANHHAFVMHGHLSQILVKEGDIVSQGQVIGKMGTSGNSDGPHLHLEVHYASDPKASFSSSRAKVASPDTLFNQA